MPDFSRLSNEIPGDCIGASKKRFPSIRNSEEDKQFYLSVIFILKNLVLHNCKSHEYCVFFFVFFFVKLLFILVQKFQNSH